MRLPDKHKTCHQKKNEESKQGLFKWVTKDKKTWKRYWNVLELIAFPAKSQTNEQVSELKANQLFIPYYKTFYVHDE